MAKLAKFLIYVARAGNFIYKGIICIIKFVGGGKIAFVVIIWFASTY